ncbi:hypothetical protein V1527DRAFT_489807 [Lipomyces starkeyi]
MPHDSGRIFPLDALMVAMAFWIACIVHLVYCLGKVDVGAEHKVAMGYNVADVGDEAWRQEESLSSVFGMYSIGGLEDALKMQ